MATTLDREGSSTVETTSSTLREPGSGTLYGSAWALAIPNISANGSPAPAAVVSAAMDSNSTDMRSLRYASAAGDVGRSTTSTTAGSGG